MACKCNSSKSGCSGATELSRRSPGLFSSAGRSQHFSLSSSDAPESPQHLINPLTTESTISPKAGTSLLSSPSAITLRFTGYQYALSSPPRGYGVARPYGEGCTGPCGGTGSFSITVLGRPYNPVFQSLVGGMACRIAESAAAKSCPPRPHKPCLCEGRCVLHEEPPIVGSYEGASCVLAIEVTVTGTCLEKPLYPDEPDIERRCSYSTSITLSIAGPCRPEYVEFLKQYACQAAITESRGRVRPCYTSCSGDCSLGPPVMNPSTSRSVNSITYSATADFEGECTWI